MTYKDGKTEPQKNDEVMGDVDGKPARGRVLAVREKTVLVTRRAAYQGVDKPLQSEHLEVESSTLSLVYRPRPKGPVPAAAAPAAKAAPKASSKKAAAPKEGAAK